MHDNSGVTVHPAINEYLVIDRDGNYTWMYLWRLEAQKRVYIPQGVEQVMDVTGLLGIIICKALA